MSTEKIGDAFLLVFTGSLLASAFRSRKFLTVLNATFAARSLSYPYTPVAMQGNAMLRRPLSTRIWSDFS